MSPEMQSELNSWSKAIEKKLWCRNRDVVEESLESNGIAWRTDSPPERIQQMRGLEDDFTRQLDGATGNWADPTPFIRG